MNHPSALPDGQTLRRIRARQRWLRRLFLISMVLVLGGLLLMVFLPTACGNWPAVLPPMGMAFLAVLCVLTVPFGRTPCPRCGKPLFQPAGCLGVFTKVDLNQTQCVHCALPLHAEDAPG